MTSLKKIFIFFGIVLIGSYCLDGFCEEDHLKLPSHLENKTANSILIENRLNLQTKYEEVFSSFRYFNNQNGGMGLVFLANEGQKCGQRKLFQDEEFLHIDLIKSSNGSSHSIKMEFRGCSQEDEYQEEYDILFSEELIIDGENADIPGYEYLFPGTQDILILKDSEFSRTYELRDSKDSLLRIVVKRFGTNRILSTFYVLDHKVYEIDQKSPKEKTVIKFMLEKFDIHDYQFFFDYQNTWTVELTQNTDLSRLHEYYYDKYNSRGFSYKIFLENYSRLIQGKIIDILLKRLSFERILPKLPETERIVEQGGSAEFINDLETIRSLMESGDAALIEQAKALLNEIILDVEAGQIQIKDLRNGN